MPKITLKTILKDFRKHFSNEKKVYSEFNKNRGHNLAVEELENKIKKGVKMTDFKTKNFFKQLKKQITKDFGKRCKSFEPICVTCIAWHGYDCLDDAYFYVFDKEDK